MVAQAGGLLKTALLKAMAAANQAAARTAHHETASCVNSTTSRLLRTRSEFRCVAARAAELLTIAQERC
jgi:hypothetical protein